MEEGSLDLWGYGKYLNNKWMVEGQTALLLLGGAGAVIWN